MSKKSENVDNSLTKLLEFSEALLREDFTIRIKTPADDSIQAKISANLNTFLDRLQISEMPNLEEAGSQLVDFIEVISSFANRDFTRKLKISDSSNVIDALATGINILGEELEYSTVSKKELEAERDQLKIQKEKVEKASRAKTVFLGNLSHEIRTPLQGILGFSEVLLSTETSETKQQQIGIIMKRARDLEEIIESLLDLATLEAGEIKPNPEMINVSNKLDILFNEYCNEYAHELTQKDLIIKNELGDDIMTFIDPVHFRQVILNLLNNSMKFTEEGTIELSAECSAEEIIINITDTGIGISKEHAALIFEPFRQAHEGFNRKADGIGLGLPICKLRVALWGGEINLVSEEGKGSTFSFSIPRQNIF